MLQLALPAGFIAPCLPTKTDKLPSGSQLAARNQARRLSLLKVVAANLPGSMLSTTRRKNTRAIASDMLI